LLIGYFYLWSLVGNAEQHTDTGFKSGSTLVRALRNLGIILIHNNNAKQADIFWQPECFWYD